MSITSIENLSNEFFYELFDYIDGYRIHQAFSNLNYRFQQLLNSSSRPFKINLDSISDELYTKIFKQVIPVYKHKIISFDFYLPTKPDHFFSSFTIDSSFDRLESLVLSQIEPTILYSLLSNLIYLPHLFSLTIDICQTLKDLNDVYPLIFALPKLKSIKCSAEDVNVPISLPFALKKQTTTIEHLVIDHVCTFKELSPILSYTPQLRRLNFSHVNDSNTTIEMMLPIILSNLSDISLNLYYITYDDFKMFITNINAKVKVLRYTTLSGDEAFLDPNRWEQLIRRYLPQLERFYLKYYQQLDSEYDPPVYLKDPNPFISPFWIGRKWLLEAEMNRFEVVYLIHPYKERWYNHNYSTDPSKSARLILTDTSRGEDLVFLMMNIRSILTVAQFYHLEISKKQIFSGTLIEIIDLLSELDSLKIHSLSLSTEKSSSVDILNLRCISNKNKITKVCLEKMIEIEEIYYLMKLCPRMNYLQVDCINNMDVEFFVRDILNKINNECNQYLRLLCFRVPTADGKMVKKLEEMINSKKLLLRYTIKRVLDHICLQWEK